MAYLPIKLRQAKDYPVVCKFVLIPERRSYLPGDVVEGKLIVSHKREGMMVRARRIQIAQKYQIGCTIVLVPDKKAYHPGDYIEGKAILSARRENMFIAGLKLAVEGSSFAKFQEREQIHHKTEVFCSESVYVVGGDHSTKTRLPPGANSYSFKIRIPDETKLPSSFKSQFGFVLYQVLAIVDTGDAFGQQLKKGEKPITVKGGLEITEEESNTGIECEKAEKGFNLGSRQATCFKYNFNTMSSGFAVGDEIPFRLSIVNEKMYDVKNAGVSLVQKVTYYGGTVSRAWKDVFQVVAEVVNENTAEVWFGSLVVGKDLPGTFVGGVVEFRYMIRVAVDTKEGVSLRSEHPVTIGTSYKVRPRAQELRAEDFDKLSLDSVAGTSTSGQSGVSFPPRYSTLSLKTHGGSFETLPPEYQDLIEEGTEKGEISET